MLHLKSFNICHENLHKEIKMTNFQFYAKLYILDSKVSAGRAFVTRGLNDQVIYEL